MFHLLSLEYRQQVADSLNRAILGWLLDFLFALSCIFFLLCIYIYITFIPIRISNMIYTSFFLGMMVFASTLKPSQLHSDGEAYTTGYSS